MWHGKGPSTRSRLKTWSCSHVTSLYMAKGTQTVRGKGLDLPFHAFSSVLFTDSSRSLYYGQGSIRRSRYAPHEHIHIGGAVQELAHGQVIWVRAPSTANTVLIVTPHHSPRQPVWRSRGRLRHHPDGMVVYPQPPSCNRQGDDPRRISTHRLPSNRASLQST